MAGDLHTHTTLSDGSTPVERLPFLAARAGLTHLAISDHDSVQSVRYAQEHPEQEGVRLIPATELSAFDYERGEKVHLLAYWPDDCEALHRHCERIGRLRTEGNLKSAAALEAICPQFRTEDALAYAADGGVLQKAHLMRALYDIGQADSIYGETYKRLFGSSKAPGPLWHEPEFSSVAEVLQTAKACRAVVVLAHPSVYHTMPLARELAAQGLIDGVEIEHPRNKPEDKQELYQLARQYELIVTGGTDYHGMQTRKPYPVGTCRTADDQIERIAALAKQRKQY